MSVPAASRMMTSDDDVTRLQQQQQHAAAVTVMAATARTTATRRHWTTFTMQTIFNHVIFPVFQFQGLLDNLLSQIESEVLHTRGIRQRVLVCHSVTCRPGVAQWHTARKNSSQKNTQCKARFTSSRNANGNAVRQKTAAVSADST